MSAFDLSVRELELLSCYARGKSDEQIAPILGIKPSYMGTLGSRMRQKMGAIDRAHAVSIAYQSGIFTVGCAP